MGYPSKLEDDLERWYENGGVGSPQCASLKRRQYFGEAKRVKHRRKRQPTTPSALDQYIRQMELEDRLNDIEELTRG